MILWEKPRGEKRKRPIDEIPPTQTPPRIQKRKIRPKVEQARKIHSPFPSSVLSQRSSRRSLGFEALPSESSQNGSQVYKNNSRRKRTSRVRKRRSLESLKRALRGIITIEGSDKPAELEADKPIQLEAEVRAMQTSVSKKKRSQPNHIPSRLNARMPQLPWGHQGTTNRSIFFQTIFWFPNFPRKLRTRKLRTDISQVFSNNLRRRTRSRRKRRSLESLKRALRGIIPIEESDKPLEPEGAVQEMQSTLSKKKRSQRNHMASRLNARMLQLQWGRQGSSPEEEWERRFSLDNITKLFIQLDINKEPPVISGSKETALSLSRKQHKERKALMRYRKDGSIIPYLSEPKVNLDSETTRVWKLLMVSSNSEGVDGNDEGTKKWWKEERNIYERLARLFNARMSIVQGDRTFFPWKSSVVDSVIGVFLTQNVTDQASSSVFIDLAAEFPIHWSPNQISYHGETESPRLSNPTCIIIEEIDSDEDTNDVSRINHHSICSTNQSKTMMLDLSQNMPQSSSKVPQTSKDKKPTSSKLKGRAPANKKENNFDWDSLRKEVESGGEKRVLTDANMDSADWDALRCTSVEKIAAILRKRGTHNKLSLRIKDFLNRLVQDHESIDLEWLRDVDPDKAKEFLMDIKGLGLKSVECVRLLSLHQIAFPVDTNVARIVVRLGWVPLQPLPDELQMHLLELYPVLDSVQKYLWPRLCKLDHSTLYQLHYHLITFGKVFCTKKKPNCNACPLKIECRHYASARASARLALPEPEESTTAIVNHSCVTVNFRPSLLFAQDTGKAQNSEPEIEEPATPEPELPDMEDYPWDDNNIIMLEKEAHTSRDLVVLSQEAASRPLPKLKKTEKLRTEHYVYELPSEHEILQGFEKRDPFDKLPYLLAIWTPGETANSIQPPLKRCVSQEGNTSCTKKKCFSCNANREDNSQEIVLGTILIPCRTAMRGRFPLNGTYFQTNEVFADHETSINPIQVPRKSIWDLERRIAYFGSSVSSSFRGLPVEAIKYSFLKGYVCVRGFYRKTGKTQRLAERLHCPPSQKKNQPDEE